MKNKKAIALILAASLAAGNNMAIFAEDGADGIGTLIPHLNKEITAVTLPTNEEVTTVFNYFVDPEALIDAAGKLADGSSTTAVTGNDDGVYFANAAVAAVAGSVTGYSISGESSGYTVTVDDLNTNTTYTYDGDDWKDGDGAVTTATISAIKDEVNSDVTFANGDTITVAGATKAGEAGYSSRSDEVKFKGQNSVDVDVTVKAEIEASDGGKDIALVADEDALEAATTPALLMQIKVGTDTKAITSDGAITTKATIEGVSDNFEVTVDDNNKYKYAVKTNVDPDTWNSTTLQLIGKTNNADVAEGMTAPKVKLTWTVAKTTTPAEPTTDASAVTTSGTSDALVRLVSGQNANVSKITSAKVNGTEVEKSNIAVSGSGNVWLKGVAPTAGKYDILITYDGTTYSATLTK